MLYPLKTKIISKQNLAPWLFLAPALILFTIYVLIPIFQSISLGFYEWDGIAQKSWIGLANYVELFSDTQFWTSLVNNIFWLVFFMIAPIYGLAIALFLNQKVRGICLVKSLFFVPFVISPVIVGMVFTWFYDPSYGLLQEIFMFFGINIPSILADERLATFGIIFAGIWPQTAYCIVLYLTALNSLNSDQIEAARIDGIKGWSLFWNIVLPQLRPATFIAAVVTIIGALRSFDLVAVMTGGGPWGSSNVLAYFMYEQAIVNYRMGYGAAIATVLFLIMLVCISFFVRRMLHNEKAM